MSSIFGVIRENSCEDVLNAEWQIDNFHSLTENVYHSPDFTFSNSCWYLKIYPKSYMDVTPSNEWISLYLERKDEYSEVVVNCTFGVKKADGTLYGTRELTLKFEGKVEEGIRQFLLRSDLRCRKSELVPSDALTVTLSLEKGLPTGELNTLSSNLKNMLVSKTNCDVTIKVQNRTFSAHKFILFARCPVFAEKFECEMAENSGIIDVTDCDEESFNDFLHYLYTGRVDNLTESKMFHLYKIADTYCVNELKSHCVFFIMEKLSVKNMCDVFCFGEQYNDQELINFSKAFFEKNVKSILLSSKWESLMKDNFLAANELLKSIAPKICNWY